MKDSSPVAPGRLRPLPFRGRCNHGRDGAIKFQATYNNQVLFNPERLYNTGQQPPTQFKGIGQGLNTQTQPATFTITFTSTTWQTQPISPVRLTFYQY